MARVNKNVGVKAARIAGEDSQMDSKANDIASDVKAVATAHRDTGNFRASIKVKSDTKVKGVRDRVVYTDDPNALSIEFGHTAKNGTFVEGIHAFGIALGKNG